MLTILNWKINKKYILSNPILPNIKLQCCIIPKSIDFLQYLLCSIVYFDYLQNDTFYFVIGNCDHQGKKVLFRFIMHKLTEK